MTLTCFECNKTSCDIRRTLLPIVVEWLNTRHMQYIVDVGNQRLSKSAADRERDRLTDWPLIQVVKSTDIAMWQDNVSELVGQIIAVIHFRLRRCNLLLKHLQHNAAQLSGTQSTNDTVPTGKIQRGSTHNLQTPPTSQQQWWWPGLSVACWSWST